jgi:hypothetical protein
MVERFEEFYEKVEKVDYSDSPCFNCNHDKWTSKYTEEGWIEWDQYCEVAWRSFGDGEFPKECPFFEEREKR